MILQQNSTLNIEILEISKGTSIIDEITQFIPDIMIINPNHFGLYPPSKLKEYRTNLCVVALVSALSDQSLLHDYDHILSIYDSAESIHSLLERLSESSYEKTDTRNELSQREKEIVVCIAKGMSNKEIADELFLSTHTVISHRRNITNKLEIYSPSGLTIYAIINKLVELDSIPAK